MKYFSKKLPKKIIFLEWHKSNQKGQTLVEFVFLLLMTILLSFFFLRINGRALGKRWVDIVNIVAAPNKVNLR